MHCSPTRTQVSNISMAMARIGPLYGIEEEIRGKSAELRHSVRQARARPLLDKLNCNPRWLALDPSAAAENLISRLKPEYHKGTGTEGYGSSPTLDPNAGPYQGSPHFRVIVCPAVTRVVMFRDVPAADTLRPRC